MSRAGGPAAGPAGLLSRVGRLRSVPGFRWVPGVRTGPRHGRRSGSPVPTLVVCIGLLLSMGAVVFTLNVGAQAGPGTPGTSSSSPGASLTRVFGSRHLDLPAATAPPAPSPPVLSTIPNLQPHEVFGFAPYWTLDDSSGFDVKDLSTLAYFSLDVNGDGSIDESGPGWVGYESQDLVNLVNRAHAAEDRIVLTVTAFDQQTLDELTSSPSAPARLGSELVSLVSAKSLDGVNFDFEGNGPADRAGLDSLISAVSSQLRGADPHWQITMDTYASSAGDPHGFYDIAGLDPSVDGFFVMAYDMENPQSPSATAPLVGPGNTDTSALEEYESVVPPSKIVLGVPAYGYDWPTSGPSLGSPATGPATPVSYAQVSSMSSPVYWDPQTETPWTSYQQGSQWHQVFFDNPTSIALKAHLAEVMHVAGIGLWALGMDGDDPAMTAALLGSAQAVKYQTGPSQSQTPSASGAPGTSTPSSASTANTTTSTTVPSPYHYGGTWNGHTETLTPERPSSLPGGGAGGQAGQLTGFTTNDPAAQCLSKGPPLEVTELNSDPSEYVVSATEPGDCYSGTWTFDAGPLPPPSPTTTTTSPLSPVLGKL